VKRLYFIAATDANGENVDLFVAAMSVPDAVAAWQEYYGRIEPGEDSSLHDIEDEEPDRVFEVPDISGMILDTWNPARPLSWHGDIKQVGGKLEKHED
jgi:hypothetical protein